ncbi:MarR family transcriptional regulator [Erythrobacter sp.]|uniref:MarR family winged helix-turn-helix transcriptional regulator n=1 Tax=Erythrobacter sp. TaxID=1042 RepID=UPI001AFE2AFF|nr:MarR family transcriptional regulator [Erythrobacter sp.]MBO6526635.1 MarR family transcriptional regulator [Erythrobacter sp.]MBO6529155.1 MarR family transcriptional regulator [Erythrobacter sp.]
MFLLKELPSDAIMSAYASRYPEMDKPATRRALETLQHASFLLRDLEQLFSRHGLSQTRFLILIVLEREGGRLTGPEIRERIDISRPVLTTTLKGLKREGYIGIGAVEGDARALEAVLLDAGRAKLAELLPEYFSITSRAGREMQTG